MITIFDKTVVLVQNVFSQSRSVNFWNKFLTFIRYYEFIYYSIIKKCIKSKDILSMSIEFPSRKVIWKSFIPHFADIRHEAQFRFNGYDISKVALLGARTILQIISRLLEFCCPTFKYERSGNLASNFLITKIKYTLNLSKH